MSGQSQRPGPTPLQVRRDGRGVVVVTLDRAHVHNALNTDLVRAVRTTFEQLSQDTSARLVVLTGAGRSFCAGADLRGMRATAGAPLPHHLAEARDLEAMLRSVQRCPKPVVARVNGHAIAGGAGLVSCTDVAVASRAARFGFSEVRLGLAPAVISPYVLAKVGMSHARRYFLTAERFDADEACRIGLVHVCVEPAALDRAVAEVVDQLLAGGPQALAEVKALLPDVGRAGSLDAAAERTTVSIARLRGSAEAQEGMAAFHEKREPAWAVDLGEE